MTSSVKRCSQRLAAVAGLLVLSSGALAQYRPPPLTEAERLTVEGDDAREEAAKQAAGGNRPAAEAKYRKAIESYEKALAAAPDSANAAAGLGAAAGALGDYAKVVQALSPVAEKQPEALDVLFHLGVALYKLKRFDEAIPRLEKVSPAKNPAHLIAHYYLAWYYLHQQRGAPAVTELNRYLEIRPPELGANDSEIYQMLGHAYLSLRKPAYARTSFERAQRGRPESLSIQMGLEAVLEMEGKLQEAIMLLDGLMARNPKATEPRERLGRVLILANDLKRAEQVASDLVRMQANANTHLLLGDVRLAQRQGPAAESSLRKALQASPGMLPAKISLAKALQIQGKNEEAIKLLEDAAKAGADTVEVWAVLGSVNRRAGHLQRAIEMHNRVVALAPTLALGYMLLGADHYATGQWDQAIDDYEAAVKLESDNKNARHWLSLALARRARQRADANRLDEAVPDLRRAYDMERSIHVARNLAQVLLAQKGFKDARVVLDSVIKQPDASWQEQMLLGYALLGSGEPEGAVAAYEQAIGMARDDDALSEIYAGWALAKLEAGDFDAAVSRMSDPKLSKRALKVAQTNMPMALLRRALSRLQQGDAESAARDVEAAKKIPSGRDSEVLTFATFVRSLVDVEEGRHGEAAAGFKKVLTKDATWMQSNARQLFDAYLKYRQGKFNEARKLLAQVQRKLTPRQADWAADLGLAINRREGERAYVEGKVPQAEKALKAAMAKDAGNPYVLHNLACVQYRKGKAAEAVATWLQMDGAGSGVREAALNLGIDAQEKKHDYQGAIAYYRKYINSGAGGARAAMARDWKDRLQAIYGSGEEAAEPDVTDAAAPSGGAQ